MLHSTHHRLPRSLSVALIVFLLAAVAAASLIWRLNQVYLQDVRSRALNAADVHADALERSVERTLSATSVLAILVRQGNGAIRDFDAIAGSMLAMYPGAAFLQLAPRGVVQSIVPLAGNEPAIGHDLLKDPSKTRAAFVARDTGKLTLDGPFNLLQGGLGAVGRLPVFLDDAKGNPLFWGFTSVLIRFPEVLETAEFSDLTTQGFAYELWRFDPDTRQKLIIAASSSVPLIEPVGYELDLPGATWTLSVAPIKGWYDSLRLSLEAILSLLFSLLLAYVAKLIVELRGHKQGLEVLVAHRTAEVQASDERFRCLTEMSSDFYWESDAEHRLTQRGSAAKKVSTVSVFELGAQIGERRWEIPYLSPDDASWQAHRAVPDAHQAFRNFEFSRLGTDGTERHISISGDPVFDAFGAFKGYRGVGSDITERKKAEATRDQLAAIVENSNDAIFSRALDGAILSWNAAAEKMFGYTASEAIGKPATFNLPPGRQPNIAGNNEQILRGEATAARESQRVTKDGRVIDVLTSHSPIRDSAGKIIGASVILHDITERKRAETARAQLAAIIENSNDAIVGRTLDGIIFSWNAAAERLYGYTAAEVIGQPTSILRPPDSQSEFEQNFALLSQGHPVSPFEALRLTKDGRRIDVRISLSPIKDEAGQVTGVASIVHDIGELKRAESRLREQVELERLLESLASAANEASTPAEAMQQCLDRICEYGKWPLGCVGTFAAGHSGGVLENTHWHAADPARFAELMRASDSTDHTARRGYFVGRVLREKRPVWLADLQQLGATGRIGRAVQYGLRSAFAFPVLVGGEIAAFIEFFADEVREPDQLFLDAIGTIGAQLASVIERDRANASLRAAAEQFRGLVEQAIGGIYIIQDGTFTYVNPRFAEIFGYGSIDEPIGRDALSVVAENERAAVGENIRQWLEGGTRSISYRTTALRKDGSIIEVGVHGTRASYRGRPAIIGMLQDISEKKRAEDEIERYVAQIKTAFMSTVEVATALGEMRDPYTAGHQRRVAELAVAIGAELGFDARQREGLRVAGYLHDIGKITIPSEILSKPGKLSSVEFQLIKGHAQSSYDVLKTVEFPWPVAQIALQHHERMDGSGYPQGLKGEAILLEARIMAVADVVEAMSSHRPYRPGLGIDKALAEIERGRGTAYDANAVDACLRLFREKRYELPA